MDKILSLPYSDEIPVVYGELTEEELNNTVYIVLEDEPEEIEIITDNHIK